MFFGFDTARRKWQMGSPDPDLLIGDPTKANTKLGWIPEYNLEQLINEMMESDLKLMTKDQYLKDGGYAIMNYF